MPNAKNRNPDRLLAAAIFGEARRLAAGGGSIAEAHQLICDLAGGRLDLVSQEAGLAAGAWAATIHRTHPVELLASGLLLTSGPVDLTSVGQWVEIGRSRATAPMYRAR